MSVWDNRSIPLRRAAILPLLLAVSCGPRYVRWSHPATTERADLPRELVIDERIQYYDVQGATLQQIRDDLNRKRPVDHRGERSDAYTKWSLVWKTRYDPGCRNPQVVLTLTIGTTLPRWSPPPAVDPRVLRSWNRYQEALAAHERGHRNTGLHAAAEAYQAIRISFDAGECDYPQSEAKAIIRKYDQINVEYDRHTAHGGNEGVELY